MAILQKDKTDGIFKAAQTGGMATAFNPITRERKQVRIGDPTAFAGGFQLETPTNKLPLPSLNQGQQQPAQTPQQDPLTIFNTNIISMLREAQGGAGNEDLYARQRALQRQSIEATSAVTPEALRGLSPEQQNALRSSTAKQVEPELDAIAATIKANDSRLTHFEGILGQMRDIGADFVKNLAPSPEIIDGYKRIIKQGGDVASIPAEVRNKVIAGLTDEDWKANQAAKLGEKKMDTQVVEIGRNKLLINTQTGAVIKNLGVVPGSGGGGGGGGGITSFAGTLSGVTSQAPAKPQQTFTQFLAAEEAKAGKKLDPFAARNRYEESKKSAQPSPQAIQNRLQFKIKNLPLNVRNNAVAQVQGLLRQGLVDDANRFIDGMGTPLGDTQITDLTQAQLAKSNVERISTLIAKLGSRGPVIGRIRQANPYDSDIVELDSMITQTVPGLARGIFKEVGVLTDQDISRYRATIANPTLTAEQADRATKQLLQTINTSIKLQLNTLDKAGKNVADFKDIQAQSEQALQQQPSQQQVQFQAPSGKTYNFPY